MRSNTYICQECAGSIYTTNDDCGTTPFMLKCRASTKCTGMMYSQFGRVPKNVIFTHEWYRRTDISQMTPDEFEHHRLGGAFLRQILDRKRPKLK